MKQYPRDRLVPQHLLQQAARVEGDLVVAVPAQSGKDDVGPVRNVLYRREARADLPPQQGGEGGAGVFAGLFVVSVSKIGLQPRG